MSLSSKGASNDRRWNREQVNFDFELSAACYTLPYDWWFHVTVYLTPWRLILEIFTNVNSNRKFWDTAFDLCALIVYKGVTRSNFKLSEQKFDMLSENLENFFLKLNFIGELEKMDVLNRTRRRRVKFKFLRIFRRIDRIFQRKHRFCSNRLVKLDSYW